MRIRTGPALSDALAEIERLREMVDLMSRQSSSAMAALASGLSLLAEQAVGFSAQMRSMEERLAALESAKAERERRPHDG